MGQLSADDVDAPEKSRLDAAGLGEAGIGQHFDVAVSDVGEGLGGGASVGTGHVRHAIVRNAFLDVNGMIVGRRVGRFSAAALVDGDVHEDTPRAHAAQHLVVDQL